MRKKIVRTISILLCLTMLCCMSVHAAEPRASEQLRSYSAILSRKSNGNLSLTFSIHANGTMDTIGVSSVKIQRSSGSTWISEHTYTVSSTPSLQTSNKNAYQNVLTHTPNYTGSSYRAVVTFYAKDSSGATTKQVITNSV